MNKSVEVTYAKLHSPLFVPTLGDYKNTLTADATGPDRNLKMYLQDNGLLLETKGHQVFIPLANVISTVLKKEAPKK